MARAYFRLFYDQYVHLTSRLSNEEAGRLFLGMLRYLSEDTEPELPGCEGIVWPLMKEDIDRDRRAYEAKCAVNAENARKGGLAKSAAAQTSAPAPAPVSIPAPVSPPQPPAADCFPSQAAPAQAKESKESNQTKKSNQSPQSKKAYKAYQSQKAAAASAAVERGKKFDVQPQSRDEYEARMRRLLELMREQPGSGP